MATSLIHLNWTAIWGHLFSQEMGAPEVNCVQIVTANGLTTKCRMGQIRKNWPGLRRRMVEALRIIKVVEVMRHVLLVPPAIIPKIGTGGHNFSLIALL